MLDINAKDIDSSTIETALNKKEATTEKPKVITVSLGNDSETLAEEKNKPKEKQDKNKIKQLEKSIKDREKEIKNQVENNKKYKKGSNAWDGVIDDENTDDYSYIVNNWKEIPEINDFKNIASSKIVNDTTNYEYDREYSLNRSQEDFDTWRALQDNDDDYFTAHKKYENEQMDWSSKVMKALEKYGSKTAKNFDSGYVGRAHLNARAAGDYDAASILFRAYKNAIENEEREKERTSKTEKSEESVKEQVKEEEPLTKEKAWNDYYGAKGTARGLFENFQTLNMDADDAKKEFLSKNPKPSQPAIKAFKGIYGSDLVENKNEQKQTETKKEETQSQNFQVGGQPRKTLNEAQSETSKNIKDVILDETYQTLTDDEKRDALKKATEKALNKYSSSFIDKANTRENAAQLSKFLPRFAIQHFLEGNFGDKKNPKSWGTLGYFLLDKVGKSLVNASQVARGFSPTEKTALENYNETMMKNAFGRDDENRKKILNSSLDTLVKDSDVLREVGISDFKIFDDFTEKVLTQYQDNIQNVNLDKILKEKSDFILNMPSEEQQKFIGYLIAMNVSEPGSAAYLNAAYRAADMEQRFAKTDAEKYAAQKSKSEIDLKLAGLDVNNKLLFGQLDSIDIKNEKDRATMAAEIDRVIRENEKLIEEIKRARTENSYLAKEKERELEQKLANIVSTYANTGTSIANSVAGILDAIIPF